MSRYNFSASTGAAALSRDVPRSVRIAAASEALTRGAASSAVAPAAPDAPEGNTATTRRGAAGAAAARWFQTARQAGASRLRSVSQRRLPADRAPFVGVEPLDGVKTLTLTLHRLSILNATPA